MQPSDYDRYQPFFRKVIADYHGVSEGARHTNNWDLSSVSGLPSDGVLDLESLGVGSLSMRVRVGRNLSDYPLPGAMSREDRVGLELKVWDDRVSLSVYGVWCMVYGCKYMYVHGYVTLSVYGGMYDMAVCVCTYVCTRV